MAGKATVGSWVLAATCLVSAATPALAKGQTVTLDEGSFRITVAGKAVGTETFSIRKNGEGADAVVIAHGRVVLDTVGGREVSASLQLAGGTLRPVLYDLRQEGEGAERIAGRLVGSHFSARIMSSTGETMREYVVSDGAVIADDGMAHQYYFVAQRVGQAGGRVPLVVPRENHQVWAQVQVAGAESIQVGDATLPARHLVVQPAGGERKDVWVDEEGRVLRLTVQSRNVVFQRTSPP